MSLWDLIAIFFNPIVVLNPNRQFLDYVSVAFSERYLCQTDRMFSFCFLIPTQRTVTGRLRSHFVSDCVTCLNIYLTS